MMAIKILGAIAAVAVVAVVTAGLLMYFRVIPIPGPILGLLLGLKEPEHSARYYPAGHAGLRLGHAGAGRRAAGGYAGHLESVQRVPRISQVR